jgi:Tetratricopeptide repeat
VLGLEHPDTLTSMGNLALTYKNKGRWDEALELLRECVTMRRKVLGANHPYTLSSSTILDIWLAEAS